MRRLVAFALTLAVASLALVATPSCKLHRSSGADGGVATGSGGFVSALADLVGFEGEIEMKTSTSFGGSVPGGSIATVFKIKGSRMRTEMSALGSDYVTIADMANKHSISLDTKAHTYTENDLSAAAAAAKSTTPKTSAKAKATGRMDKVAGYACEIYDIDDPAAPGPPVEVCVASGISTMAFGLAGPFSMFSKKGADDGWSMVMAHGFPLRIVMRDPSGAPIVRLEATRVEKMSEPDALFEVPAGYTRIASPAAWPTSGGTSAGSSP